MNTRSIFFVDWISAVLPFETLGNPVGIPPLHSDAQRVMSILFKEQFVEETRPRWGYSLAWRAVASGAVIQVHPDRYDMGVNIVLTGQTLERMGWAGPISALRELGARFTRVDLSVDIRDEQFDLQGLYEMWDAGGCETKARRASLVMSETGSTFYVGARTSEKFLRVYDKGGQQGGQQGEWFRIELEAKGAAAQWIAKNIDRLDGAMAVGVICSYFDAPHHPGWARAMVNADKAEYIPSDKKRPDTERWLLGMVADTMAAMEKLRAGFLDEFYDLVVSKL